MRAQSALGVSLDPDRFLIVGNARSRRSAYLYEPGRSEPSFVAKIAQDDRARERCMAEHRALERFSEYAIPGVIAPRPRGTMEHDNRFCFFQEVLVSEQWMGRLPLHHRELRGNDLRRATDHLIAVHHATRRENTDLTEGGPRCYQHGDFWIGNLGLRGSSLVLYDFEHARHDGLPLFDLLHFALYYAVALRNVGRVGREVATGRYDRRAETRDFSPRLLDVEGLFVRPGRVRDTVASCVRGYADACGLEVEQVARLLKAYVEEDRGVRGLEADWETRVLE